MPPKKSTRQNSIANSHVEARSQGHSHAMGETHAKIMDRLLGVRIPWVVAKFLVVEKPLLVDHSRWY